LIISYILIDISLIISNILLIYFCNTPLIISLIFLLMFPWLSLIFYWFFYLIIIFWQTLDTSYTQEHLN